MADQGVTNMKVIITGGAGFLGQVLAKRILSKKTLRSEGETGRSVSELILADIAAPKYLFDLPSLAKDNGVILRVRLGDILDPDYCKEIVGTSEGDKAGDGLSIFHLGAVMSGAPPDLALKVNLHGTINMLEAARAWYESQLGNSPSQEKAVRPTFVYSSAGFTVGAGHPADWVSKDDTISDATRATPHNTYGTTKACAELLLADYSRRGFVDGRGVRLPSVIIRAGSPNAATTSCFSSVVREPLAGKDISVPLGPDVMSAVTGYRGAIDGMLAVHNAMPDKVDALLGFDRTVFLPTRTVSLRLLEEATKKVVSPDSVPKLGKVIYDIDQKLSDIVGSFPAKVDSSRALALGAPATPPIEDLIQEYCEDFFGALAEGMEPAETETSEEPETEAASKDEKSRVVALITGGGSGIGRAVAVRLSKGRWGGCDGKGADDSASSLTVSIVLAGRRHDPLLKTKELCEAAAKDAGVDLDVLVVPTDVTKEEDVQSLMSAVTERFKRCDLLFNNAGISMPPMSVEKITDEDFTRIMDTNLTACWRMAKHVMQLMSQQTPRKGGRIINNGSISAYTPRPGSAPYTVSKHAVLGLTKSIALDGRMLGVACGQVDFGNVASDMTKSMSTGMPQANGTTAPEPTFSVSDAADTVHAMASLPLEANILNATVMASGMPFVGRG